MLPADVLVLDAGSGEAFYPGLFKSQRYMSLEISQNCRPMIRGNIYALPFQDETLDAVLCSEGLEHLTAPQLALQELWLVVKPKGYLFIAVPFFYPMHYSQDSGDYCR